MGRGRHGVREVVVAKEPVTERGGCQGKAVNGAAEKINSHQGQVVKGDEKWAGRGDTAGWE